METASKPAATLGESDWRRVYFACSECSRRGRYNRATLIRLFGELLPVRDLPWFVSKWRQCPKHGNGPLTAGGHCGIYIDLAAHLLEDKRAKEAQKHSRG